MGALPRLPHRLQRLPHPKPDHHRPQPHRHLQQHVGRTRQIGVVPEQPDRIHPERRERRKPTENAYDKECLDLGAQRLMRLRKPHNQPDKKTPHPSSQPASHTETPPRPSPHSATPPPGSAPSPPPHPPPQPTQSTNPTLFTCHSKIQLTVISKAPQPTWGLPSPLP